MTPMALPEIDFVTFILSLGSSALLYLGEIPDPANGKTEPNLPLAKQTIDIIALLQEKTNGNLEEAEQQLFQTLLYDLRIKYVDAQKKSSIIAPPAPQTAP